METRYSFKISLNTTSEAMVTRVPVVTKDNSAIILENVEFHFQKCECPEKVPIIVKGVLIDAIKSVSARSTMEDFRWINLESMEGAIKDELNTRVQGKLETRCFSVAIGNMIKEKQGF